jgi:hypothetical protein
VDQTSRLYGTRVSSLKVISVGVTFFTQAAPRRG